METKENQLDNSKNDATPFDKSSSDLISKLPSKIHTWQWYVVKVFHYIGRGMMGIVLLVLGASGYARLQGHRAFLFEDEGLPFLVALALVFAVGGTIEFYSAAALKKTKIINYKFITNRVFYSLKNKEYDDIENAKIITSMKKIIDPVQGFFLSNLLSYTLLAENSNLNGKDEDTIKYANIMIKYCEKLLLQFRLIPPLVYYLHGRAYLLKRDMQSAIKSYETYLSINPTDKETEKLLSSLRASID
jgi:hypothetical protein